MFYKTTLLIAGLALSGCVTNEPSPARQTLLDACQGGNLQACYAIESLDAQDKALDQQRGANLMRQGQAMMRGNPAY